MPSYPPTLPIQPFTRPVRGSVTLPGSKSITNRALILAALAKGTTTLHGALFSRDTRIMVTALRALGFIVVTNENALTITIAGRGGEIPVREATIDVGNAGTAARFLTAFVCLRPDGIYHFDGDEAMRRRPIGALLEALESQGAQASSRNFPFTLRTAGLPGGVVSIDASESSQLLSALIMAAPKAKSPLAVTLVGETVSRPFIHMTERMVEQFRAPVADYAIEGDATAASYFAELVIATGGSVEVNGLNLEANALQGDAAFFRLLAAKNLIATSGKTASHGSSREGVTADFNDFSDTFLSLAAIAPLLDGPTKISGIAHTRKQETDRVAGMARELTKLGQHVIETEDALEIHPRPLTIGVEIETYHDHRFAMSFGVLGCHNLRGDGQPWLSIKDPACCSKTFPAFFDLLEALRTGSH
ncbi:3-phosphoshikimate 1-carboxyvinyltransferase [Oleiharenicola lentus]|uniref:3-phosphoshikimate 1-carboxyvinyltransferase n=1 Tax=Oleiharenicola lentus TaxID=2508720 RepID=UPI003F66DA93